MNELERRRRRLRMAEENDKTNKRVKLAKDMGFELGSTVISYAGLSSPGPSARVRMLRGVVLAVTPVSGRRFEFDVEAVLPSGDLTTKRYWPVLDEGNWEIVGKVVHGVFEEAK